MGISDSDLSEEIAVVDTGNSTTLNLGSNATYTGTWTDILLYNNVVLNILSDKSSATNGVAIQWSNNGSTIHSVDYQTMVATIGQHFIYGRVARYYRIVYTNGATAQTSFSLQAVLTRGPVTPPTITGGQLIPTMTNKLRITTNITSVSLPNTNAYQTLYSRTGTGLFFGFQAAYNHANVNTRLTIDGGVVFTLKLADVKLFQFDDTTSGRMQMGGFLATSGNVFDFSPKFPVPYTTSLLLEAASSDGANHSNSNWIIIGTEDT